MPVSLEPLSRTLRFLRSDRRTLALGLFVVLGFEWACSSEPPSPDGSGGLAPGVGGGAGPDGAGGQPGPGAGGTTSSGGAVGSSGGTSALSGGAPGTGGVGAPAGGAGTGGGAWEGPWPPAETFSNPILWEDIADPEVLRVGDVF
jgi:hypothetical protein